MLVGENNIEHATCLLTTKACPLCSIRITQQHGMRERKAADHEGSDDTADSYPSNRVSTFAQAGVPDNA